MEPTGVSTDDRVFWTLAPAAAGQILSACEGLYSIKDYGPDGLLRGRSRSTSSSWLPLYARRFLDTRGGAFVVHGLNLVGGALTLTARRSHSRQVIGAALMSASALLFENRNPYGRDGSDQMSGVVNGYRVVTAFVPGRATSNDVFLRAVNAQTTLSYLASGLAKAISHTWRSGRALEMVLQTEMYGHTPAAKYFVRHPRLARLLTWSTVAWESGYPLIFLLPRPLTRLALLGVKAFHLGIAVTMGLPRFLWGFSGAHSAVEYVLDQRGDAG